MLQLANRGGFSTLLGWAFGPRNFMKNRMLAVGGGGFACQPAGRPATFFNDSWIFAPLAPSLRFAKSHEKLAVRPGSAGGLRRRFFECQLSTPFQKFANVIETPPANAWCSNRSRVREAADALKYAMDF
jgi:hypothetical protein